jgi:hypothetical protein
MSEWIRRLLLRVLVIVGYPMVLFMNWLGGSAHAGAETRASAAKLWRGGHF